MQPDGEQASAAGVRAPTPAVVAVVGPTATGKSDLAVGLALALAAAGQPVEVVNADSMQLYRGMDVGTAKLTVEQRRGVPHHLLDVWPVTRTASAADYQRLARTRISEINARGSIALLVGGSGLYVRAVIDPLEFPGTDPALRERLEAELDALGPQALHDRLATVDPAAAAAILATNGRRIVRALEVVTLTQRPFTAALPPYAAVLDVVQVGLDLPPAELDARVDARVDAMFASGLVDEVRDLEGDGLREGRTASRALGYHQVLAMLDGTLTEAEARAETARATRRFVRRQRSWFGRDPRIDWVDPTGDRIDQALSALRRS